MMSEPIVKVKLVNFLGNKSEITIKPTGDYISNEPSVVLHGGETYVLKIENGKLALSKLGNTLYINETFSLTPTVSNSQLSVNNRPYLGSFDFIVENGQYIRPINSILMEDYLKGVVPIEMYPSWNIEALKTQAVAARTYAMSYLSRGIINDTVSYQVYGGYIWTPNTTKAVDETTGQVLKYNGRLIDAVYSASNGGSTESNANAWGNVLVAYLPIKQDTFDTKSVWSFTLNKKQIDLTNKDLGRAMEWWTLTKEVDGSITSNIKYWLSNNGYANRDIKIVSISDFSMHSPNSSGRVGKGNITIEFLVKDIVDETGMLVPQRLTIMDATASKIRSIIGTRIILSTLIDSISTETDVIRVQGRGDGHGVGMSQWGAKYRADAGHNYKEILKFYYSGVEIPTLYDKNVTGPPTIVQETLLESPSKELGIPVVQQAVIKTEEVSKPVTNNEGVSPPMKVTTKQVTVPQVTKAPIKPVLVATKKDKTAPIIKDFKAQYNNTSKKVWVSYSVNESTKVKVYVKNSKGAIIRYLEKDISKKAGKFSISWDVRSYSNGTYTIGVNSTDLAGNQASTVLKYALAKPNTSVRK
jgi:stage II sporulation protein D